jgi:hypothetical protein
MIRIANMLNDSNSTVTKKTYLVSLLPAWLLNSDYTASQSCVMTDLSGIGAAILIPQSQASAAEVFDLIVLSPDNENEILAILPAEQRWRDEDHSPDHIKIGVTFSEMNSNMAQVINKMINVFNPNNIITRPDIPCAALSLVATAQT